VWINVMRISQRCEEERVSLGTIVREWGRIGVTGFGGPPAHISMLRRLCVEERQWIAERDFEDGISACNLLPGPASTQLAIFCAWRLRRVPGALVGGLCFILPGFVIILGLSALFLEHRPPHWVLGAAAGAGAVVPAVALNAARGFVPASWRRIGPDGAARVRWCCYAGAGALSAALFGEGLVLVLVACGAIEIWCHRRPRHGAETGGEGSRPAGAGTGTGRVPGIGLIWVAFKVGALSYGGGFVIIPLMQHDAVSIYHWMTGAQFLNAVALGQVTPGPVVLTVAVVGYGAAGVGGALLATAVAFAPSFGFVIFGGPRFDAVRHSSVVQGFLTGAGPAVVGGIAGSAVPLGLAFGHLWQAGVLAVALAWLLALRRGVVSGLLAGGGVGVLLAFSGMAVGH
jgi:chromate transporter